MQITSHARPARRASAFCALVLLLPLLTQAAAHANTLRAAEPLNPNDATQGEYAHARLWRELQARLAAKDEAGARAVVARDAAASQALYDELLYECMTSRLYGNPRMPFADEARAMLAESGAESRALEAKFGEWLKDQKPGVGFTSTDTGLSQALYLAQVAKLRGEEKDAGKDALAGKPRELIERALSISESSGNELAAASFNATLAVYALRERRLEDVPAPVARAEKIWEAWAHPVGLYQAPLILGFADSNAGRWHEAAEHFAQAAERARAMPELLPARVDALGDLAAVRRNAGDKEGVLEALGAAAEDQQKVLDAAPDADARLKASKLLADLQVQTGGALAALSRHVEATEWYVRADALKKQNYKAERAQIESQLAGYEKTFKERIEGAKTDDERKALRGVLRTVTDTMLSLLDTEASHNNDAATVVRVAERRLDLAREGGDPSEIADVLEKVATAERKAGDFERARASALEALMLRQSDPRHRRIYQTLDALAEIAYYSEDWDGAVARYKEVLEATRPGAYPPPYDLDAEKDTSIRRVRARMNDLDRLMRQKASLDARLGIGNILSEQGNFRAADEMLTGLERDTPRLYAVGAPDEAELLKWIEESKNPDLTDVEVAAHRRAVGFAPDADEEQRLGFAQLSARAMRASVLSYRARLYESQNDLERAAQTYERANALMSNLVGGSFSLTGTYVALARIERERGNYEAAESPVAAALAEAVRRNDPALIATLLEFQSTLRREEGKLDEATRLAEDSLKIALKLDSRGALAGSLRTLGRAEFARGGTLLKQSEAHLRESVTLWKDLGLPAHAAYTLDSLGQTLEALGRDDEALAAYVEGVRTVESMVGSLPASTSVETFNASRGNRELYDHLIKLLIRKGRAGDALQYLERYKSKSLVDALVGTSVASKDPALNALLTRVRTTGEAVRVAEKELADELSRPLNERDAAKVTSLQAKAAQARRAYAASVEDLKRANPSYASLVAVSPTNLSELRRRLPEKTVLLSYFPTADNLYVFVLTRDSEPSARAVAVKHAELARMVNQYRDLAIPSAPARGLSLEKKAEAAGGSRLHDIKEVNAVTAKLYDALLAPVQAEVERADTILIVPSAELYYLPFHALGRANADGSIDYLIERKRFAYLASADLLNVVAEDGARSSGSSRAKAGALLALGNPDGSLPGASQEVAALSTIIRRSKVYTGDDATVERVTEADGVRPSYVHFATHGIVNSRDPKESYLLLAGDPGRLSVRDLVEDTYKLSFDGTRLVTLSACNTNIGGYDPGAAYESLSRAFEKAGAPTVIASLWSVDDNSTRDTMTVFYRELAAGTPKAEALRRAQLSVLHNPRYAHPFFWAPFVMLGEWR
jgi:CHAT domain-containing protein